MNISLCADTSDEEMDFHYSEVERQGCHEDGSRVDSDGSEWALL